MRAVKPILVCKRLLCMLVVHLCMCEDDKKLSNARNWDFRTYIQLPCQVLYSNYSSDENAKPFAKIQVDAVL